MVAMQKRAERSDKALARAAKYVCNLRCGLCPMREPDFKGCPTACSEETRPWQCWVAHFKAQEQEVGAGCR